MTSRTPSQQISDELGTWPGVQAAYGRRGELAFKVGRREIGHLHGDRSAHFSFPKELWLQLMEQGRITEHPVFPGRAGLAARKLGSDVDVQDVIALLRLNYERASRRRDPEAHSGQLGTAA